MPQIIIDSKNVIFVFEYRPDRQDARCICKHDIIELPENIFSKDFLEKLKRAECPIELGGV